MGISIEPCCYICDNQICLVEIDFKIARLKDKDFIVKANGEKVEVQYPNYFIGRGGTIKAYICNRCLNRINNIEEYCG